MSHLPHLAGHIQNADWSWDVVIIYYVFIVNPNGTARENKQATLVIDLSTGISSSVLPFIIVQVEKENLQITCESNRI